LAHNPIRPTETSRFQVILPNIIIQPLDSSSNWGGSAAEPRFHLDFPGSRLLGHPLQKFPVNPEKQFVINVTPEYGEGVPKGQY
jgi:hypothetical protein